MIFDEPSSNLDELNVDNLCDVIKELNDKIVIIITHKPRMLKICNKVYNLCNGVFIEK